MSRVGIHLRGERSMSTWMIYGLIIFFVGYVIGEFISAEVGKVVAVIGAVLFVAAYTLSVIR